MTVSPAVKVAKNGQHKEDEIVISSRGYSIRLKPVPPTLIEEAQAQIKEPDVPRQKIEGKEGLYDNPNDPDYIKAKQDAYRKQAQAGFDTMTLFGIELVDGLPEDNSWLKNLRFMTKRGLIDLDGYDLDDPFELEFIYKKYIVMGNDDWVLLSVISGITQEDIDKAVATFPG